MLFRHTRICYAANYINYSYDCINTVGDYEYQQRSIIDSFFICAADVISALVGCR